MRKSSVLLSILLCVGASACAASPDQTSAVEPLDAPPTIAPTVPPTVTEAPTELPTETPIPEATAAPTESGEFISPYTPSAPLGTGTSLDPIVLQLNLSEGAAYRIRTLTSQTVSQDFQGLTLETDQQSGFEYTYTVTMQESDGSAWIDVTYTRALYEIDSTLGTVSYDSADPGPVPEGVEAIAAIVGSGFSIRVLPDGEILEIQGLEEMYDQMLAALETEDPQLRSTFELAFREQFGERALKEQLGSLLFEFPEQPISVGDSWNTTQETTVIAPMVVENTYTLLDFDQDQALIEVSSTVRLATEEGGLNMGLMVLDFTMTGAQEGQIQVDLKTGLSNSVVNQILTGEMTAEIEGEQITIPMTIDQTVQVESVQIAP